MATSMLQRIQFLHNYGRIFNDQDNKARKRHKSFNNN